MENSLLNKIILLVSTLFIMSFALEWFLGWESLSIVLLAAASALCFIYVTKQNQTYKLEFIDIALFIFILYVLINSVITGSSELGLRVVLASLFPYFIGRMIIIDNDNKKIFDLVLNIIGWIIIVSFVYLYLKYDRNAWATRTYANINRISMGEILGIFAIENLFFIQKDKLANKIYRIIAFIASIGVNMVILNARGTVLAIAVTAILVKILSSKNKIKYVVLGIVCIVAYFILFQEGSFIFDIIPGIERFSFKNILSDPSVIGSDRFGLGRVQLYQICYGVFCNNPVIGGGPLSVYPHNIFFEVLGAFGVIGFGIFFVFIVSAVKKFMGCIKNERVITAIFLYCLLYRQTSFAFDSHKSLFLITGIMVSQYLLSKKQEKNFSYNDVEKIADII